MTAPTEDRVEIAEEIEEVTQAQAEKDPRLRADQVKAKEGVLDDPDPAKFEASELEAAEDLIVTDEESESGGAGGGAPISAHQRRALTLAVSQKGMRENPKGSNDNQFSRYFGFGPQFWCADFVAFCVDKTGNRDKKVPWGYPSAVRNITAWGKRNGTIHSQPQPGDIFTRKDGMHTGFVLTARGSSFMTIEGNTSGPGGDFYVASHARDASSGMYFFVRDDFGDA
jgi:hypothetical protein